jgi:hypothetical protein
LVGASSAVGNGEEHKGYNVLCEISSEQLFERIYKLHKVVLLSGTKGQSGAFNLCL